MKIVFGNGSRADSTSATHGNDGLDDAGTFLGAKLPSMEVDALGIYLFPGAGPQPFSNQWC